MSTYTVTSESDRMGCRLEGASVEHLSMDHAQIISDGIPLVLYKYQVMACP